METPKIGISFLSLLLILSLGLTLFLFLPSLEAIILGISLGVVFNPVYEKIKKATSEKEGLASILTVIIVLILVITPLTILGINFFQSISQIDFSAISKSELLERLRDFTKETEREIGVFVPGVSLDFDQYIELIIGWIIQNINRLFFGLTNVIFAFFLSMFVLYYFLKDGTRLKKHFIRLVPLLPEHNEEVLLKLSLTAKSVLKGSLLMGIIQGFLTGVGFFIFGVPNPVLWGGVGVIASFIPVFGTALVIVPGAAYLYFLGNGISAFGLIIWGLLLVGMIDNFLRPHLIERGVKIHPLLILLGVIGGLAVFGPMGFLIGPLIVSLTLVLFDIYPSIALQRDHKQ